VDEWRMPPFMGLTSWAAFKTGKKEDAMVMGDLVLFEDEVSDTMSAALGSGLKVTALHNHFLFDKPHVLFMHIEGEGKVDALGGAVRRALDEGRYHVDAQRVADKMLRFEGDLLATIPAHK